MYVKAIAGKIREEKSVLDDNAKYSRPIAVCQGGGEKYSMQIIIC